MEADRGGGGGGRGGCGDAGERHGGEPHLIRAPASDLTILVPDAHYADEGDLERATAGPDVAWHVYRERDPARIPEDAWGSADAVLAWLAMLLDARAITRLTRCRVIVGCGVGVDRIDVAAAGRAGIAVCNVPDYGTGEVADHALGLILALARGIVRSHEALRADLVAGWRSDLAPTLTRLQGARLGLVGLGRIGRAVATRAPGLGLAVVVYDPHHPSVRRSRATAGASTTLGSSSGRWTSSAYTRR